MLEIHQTQNLVAAATFMAEPLQDTLQFWVQELDLPLQIRFAPYNQVFQQLLDPTSLLRTNSAGLNVLLIRLEDLARSTRSLAVAASNDTHTQIEQNTYELLASLQTAAAASSVPWLVCLCPASKAALATTPLAELLSRLEQFLAAELAAVGSLYLLRPQDLFGLYPVPDYDASYANQLGHMPYNGVCYTALATLIARKVHALGQPAKKVVVLDCDQTLWRGVCGEEGASGIALDAHRRALQNFMRQQLDHGMLLCLCSKNNPADVADVFRRRPEMPLRPEHFVAQRINWLPKSENLRSLAAELNLGLDSFILVDDNPMECAEVAAHCPEVLTLPLPQDPAEWAGFLQHVWAFDHLKVTVEDRHRTTLYQQNRRRQQLQSEAGSLADFLARLNLEVQIEPARPEQLSRVVELTQRTNQFNCTAQRCTEAELRKSGQEKGGAVLAVTVSDRFGDYGLVGLVAYHTLDRVLAVDTFLLSCRVLGKGVEHRMLARLGQIAQQQHLARVDVPFRPTGKNQPALDFLNHVGAGFRQDLHGSAVFRFPAAVAADTAFDPQNAQADPLLGSTVAQPLAPSPALKAQLPQRRRYGWIAQHARSPEQIVKLIPAKALHSRPLKGAHVPPQTQMQRQLCDVWQQVLRLEEVGIRDDFFELGGTSLLAVQLLAKWEKLTGQRLVLATLFKAPTIEGLAAELARS